MKCDKCGTNLIKLTDGKYLCPNCGIKELQENSYNKELNYIQ